MNLRKGFLFFEWVFFEIDLLCRFRFIKVLVFFGFWEWWLCILFDDMKVLDRLKSCKLIWIILRGVGEFGGISVYVGKVLFVVLCSGSSCVNVEK